MAIWGLLFYQGCFLGVEEGGSSRDPPLLLPLGGSQGAQQSELQNLTFTDGPAAPTGSEAGLWVSVPPGARLSPTLRLLQTLPVVRPHTRVHTAHVHASG